MINILTLSGTILITQKDGHDPMIRPYNMILKRQTMRIFRMLLQYEQA